MSSLSSLDDRVKAERTKSMKLYEIHEVLRHKTIDSGLQKALKCTYRSDELTRVLSQCWARVGTAENITIRNLGCIKYTSESDPTFIQKYSCPSTNYGHFVGRSIISLVLDFFL